MTWLDIAAIVFIVICAAVGARLGSLWVGACLIGGFLGSFLADTYVYALKEYLGAFPGAFYIAWGVLFLGGLSAILIPGFFLSRIGSALLLGVIDSAAGLLAGVLSGMAVVALVIFFVFPMYPKIQKRPLWKKSTVVKPSYQALESFLDQSLNRKRKFGFGDLKALVPGK